MKTWVAVASGARARLFESSARRAPLREVADLVNPEEPLPARALKSDRPGRSVDARGGRGHAMQTRVGPKEQVARRFAKRVIERLERGLKGHDFDRLYLVAPPHFLGLLRGQMDAALARSVRGELPKDLTREHPSRIQLQTRALV
jgi:protein required for attachment to host cells